MRIALVSYEYPPDTGFGGIGTYTKQAAHMLAGRGHSVEVFTGALESSSSTKEGEVLLHRVFSPTRLAFRNAVAVVFDRRHSHQAFDIIEGPEYMADSATIRENHPDTPHVIKLHTPEFLLGRLFRDNVSIAKKMRFIFGGLIRGQNPKPFWVYEKSSDPEYHLTRSVPYILHPSKELGTIVSREWDLPMDRFIHLPYPFQPDPAFLEIPCGESGSEFPRITFIGKLEKRKGIFPFMHAIPQIAKKHPHIRFRFLGHSHPSPVLGLDMEGYLKKQLSSFQDRLEFTGPIPYHEIPQHLAETDICVFPSLWENFPNVCLEAMSAGRAVVGSKNGGMADMLGENEFGLLIDPKKPESIVAAIKLLIESPELRYRFGHSARENVLTTYSYDKIGHWTEKVYSNIINNWPRS